MANITSATLYLYIYTGEFSLDKPSEANYVLYKDVQQGKSVITFEIAELVKDYIDINFTGDYYSITQTAWAEWDLIQDYDDSSTHTLKGQAIASSGYGYFQDAINPQLLAGALISSEKLYNYEGEEYKIPFLTGGEAAFKAEFYNGNTLLTTAIFGRSYVNVSADTTDYTADTTQLRADKTFTVGGTSQTIQYVEAPANTTKVVTTLNNGTVETKYIETISEGKYTPYKISFLNKFGVLQDMWFFKKRTDSVNVSKEQYKENTLQTTNAVNYSLNQATEIPYNFKTQKSLVLNTGFINEEYNEIIQQLLLTEYAWINEDGDVTPVVPKTSTLEYKTGLNDKVINYTVNFDYAFNEVNLIR